MVGEGRGEEVEKRGDPSHGPKRKELRILQIHTIAWISEMEGERNIPIG